jgi:hypothetical protein
MWYFYAFGAQSSKCDGGVTHCALRWEKGVRCTAPLSCVFIHFPGLEPARENSGALGQNFFSAVAHM